VIDDSDVSMNILLADTEDKYHEDEAYEILISDQILQLGKRVLVAYANKRTKRVHVGLILSMNCHEPIVKFTQKADGDSAFV
jgi:hypothetical protein